MEQPPEVLQTRSHTVPRKRRMRSPPPPYLTKALAAVSLLQMKTWHSSTLMPDVRRRMAAKSGGWFMLGLRAKGESSGRKRCCTAAPFGRSWSLPGTSTYRTAAQ